MIRNCTAIGLLLCLLAGCTSFRTTALYRFDNDSVVPECNNQKLKGIPVKLKVPSHVRVVISEQQLILANAEGDQTTLDAAVASAAEALKKAQIAVASLDANVDAAKAELQLAESERRESSAKVTREENSADDDDRPARIVAAKLWQTAAVKRVAVAQSALVSATEATASRGALENDVKDREATLAVAIDAATVGYTLVSFSPAQLIVETHLEYTDKVFLVDFRRPAGGILNLKGAAMDDEQYFSNIQAEVTERTLEDVSTAIETVQGAIVPKPTTPNTAKPTAANTSAAEAVSTVDFQKSVVATQRFDISEPDWEARMMAFVNERLSPAAGPQSHELSEYSEGSTHNGVTPVPAEPGMSFLPGN